MATIAAHYQHLGLFRFLLEQHGNNEVDYSVVLEVCRTGSKNFSLALNEKFPDILQRDYFAGTPLTTAIWKG
jgi:hypothetical protein